MIAIGAIARTLATDLAAKVALLGTWIVVGRSLEPEAFGAFAGLTAAAVLGSAVWDAGVSQLLMRELQRTTNRDHLLHRLVVMRTWTLPLGAAIFTAGAVVVSGASPTSVETLFGFGLVATFSSLSLPVVAYLRGSGAFGLAGLSLAATRWGSLLCVFLAAVTQPTLGMFSFALAFGEAVGLVAALGCIRAVHWTGRGSDSPTRVTLRAALPFGINALLGTAYNRFDVVILTQLAGASEVARYAPASRLQDALFMLPNAVSIVALPFAARLVYRDSSLSSVRNFTRWLALSGLVISLPLTFLSFIYANQVLSIVLGPQYSAAATPTRIVLLFLPFAMLSAPLLASIAAAERAGDTSKIFGLAFAVSVSLHLALDRPFGAVGGAAATLAREPFVVAATLAFAYRAGVIGRRT